MTSEREASSASERRGAMRQFVDERAFVSVSELSQQFGVSTVTVRGDLDALEKHGSVRRIRGGAMPLTSGALMERTFEESAVEATEAKARIAAAAVDLLEPGMSVLLDVGTTTAAIARELLRRDDLHDLTVITSGLSIALLLESAIPRLRIVVTGGTLRPPQHSLVAPLATTLLSRLHADIALLGCNGVDARAGITNINLPEAEVKAAMLKAASRTVVVADGTKIGRITIGRIAAAEDVNAIITDASAPVGALRGLRRLRGPSILVV